MHCTSSLRTGHVKIPQSATIDWRASKRRPTRLQYSLVVHPRTLKPPKANSVLQQNPQETLDKQSYMCPVPTPLNGTDLPPSGLFPSPADFGINGALAKQIRHLPSAQEDCMGVVTSLGKQMFSVYTQRPDCRPVSLK